LICKEIEVTESGFDYFNKAAELAFRITSTLMTSSTLKAPETITSLISKDLAGLPEKEAFFYAPSTWYAPGCRGKS
jgi:hypothetical protein